MTLAAFSWADCAAAMMLLSLIAYAVLGGADFGGGVWDMLARGPRAKAQRQLIEQALAPVWEANHVWLILVIVLMFTCFPSAFSLLCTALHIPLTFLVLGIVLRGAGFIFRQYGQGGQQFALRSGRVFAMASTLTPIFLGVILGSIITGDMRVVNDLPVAGFIAPWLQPLPFVVGILSLALFAFLAAVYLTLETSDRNLQNDFRMRALCALLVTEFLALITGALLPVYAETFFNDVIAKSLTIPWIILTMALAAATFWALWRGKFKWARYGSIGFAAMLIGGFGFGQYPFIIRPNLTLTGAAAPEITLRLTLGILALGSCLLLPSLYWLLKIFKARPTT